MIFPFKILCHWKSVHNWYTFFTSGHFCVLWSSFLPKMAMEAKKLKSITTLPLRLTQKEPKKSQKVPNSNFQARGANFLHAGLFLANMKIPDLIFYIFGLKGPKKGSDTSFCANLSGNVVIDFSFLASIALFGKNLDQRTQKQPEVKIVYQLCILFQ